MVCAFELGGLHYTCNLQEHVEVICPGMHGAQAVNAERQLQKCTTHSPAAMVAPVAAVVAVDVEA